MSPLHLVVPTDADAAVRLLSASPVPFDSPTNARFRTREHLDRTFATGRRRPDWVWAACADDGAVVASVAGLAVGDGIVLDLWGGAPGDGLRLVLDAASRTAAALPEAEACMFTPPQVDASHPAFVPWAQALDAAGWRHLVDRRHYEFAPPPGLARSVPGGLRLDPLTGPDDPRLPAVVTQVLCGSLDAHDVDLVRRVGLEQAGAEATAALLGADPWECIRLAYEDTADTTSAPDGGRVGGGGREPVGLVSWCCTPDGRGFVLLVGVAEAARGRGHGRRLLAAATRALVDDGATTLVADTDVPNLPMGAILADVGWQQTETRIDLVRR